TIRLIVIVNRCGTKNTDPHHDDDRGNHGDANDKFANGAATGNARDEACDEWREGDDPAPYENGPPAMPTILPRIERSGSDLEIGKEAHGQEVLTKAAERLRRRGN